MLNDKNIKKNKKSFDDEEEAELVVDVIDENEFFVQIVKLCRMSVKQLKLSVHDSAI